MFIFLASYFKDHLPIVRPKNHLTLRVLPNDLDINLHMNNGRYQTICDLTRVDMFIRTGLAKTMVREKWIPIISEHTMKYKWPLKLFQKYQVQMEVTRWDEKAFYMTHVFILKGRVVAEGTSVGMIKGKEGTIAPELVMRRVEAFTKP